MQIQKVQGNNTNFGYNPMVNSKLISELNQAKKNKASYDYIKNLCQITNQTEQKLREAERKGKPELTHKIAQVFLPIKIILTEMVDALFPKLKYKETEVMSYTDEIVERSLDGELKEYINELHTKNDNEIDTNKYHWLTKLVGNIVVNPEEEAKGIQNLPDLSEMSAEEVGDSVVGVLQQIFPGAKIVTTKTNLKDLAKEAAEEIAEELWGEGAEFAEEAGENALAESIKLGKEKVVEYIPTEAAKLGFAGLGGMKELKELLNERIVGVLKDPEQAKLDAIEYGKKIPKGLLLYGPPGCGKTTILEHLSTEAGVPLLKLETGSLKTAYYHESSKNIDAAFDYAESIATPEKPVMLMIDDADSFFVARNDRTTQFEGEEMTTFLNRIQRAPQHNVMVVATTNKYDIMDPAVRRRFDEQAYVGLPDMEARKSIIKLFLNQRTKGQKLAQDEQGVEQIAKRFEGFPISAIQDISNKASLVALKDGRREISVSDYEKIISESQNMKIKEQNYKTNAERKPIGYNSEKK